MLYLAFIVVAMCQLSYAQPVVVDCQDVLAEWLHGLTNRTVPLTCDSLLKEVEDTLGDCSPYDTVFMMVQLQEVYDIYYNGLFCTNHMATPAVGYTDCVDTLGCLEPMFGDNNLTSTLGTTEDAKMDQQATVDCLVTQDAACSVADVIAYTLSTAAIAVENGPACVTDNGIFETEAGTGCLRWTWMYNPGARKDEFKAAPGTIFSADSCGLAHQLIGKCYN